MSSVKCKFRTLEFLTSKTELEIIFDKRIGKFEMFLLFGFGLGTKLEF